MQTMYYIGLDVHKRTISYCVKDGSGMIHAEGTIPATRLDLDRWMKTLPQPWTAAKATAFTGWIYDHLQPHAAALKVAHPLMRTNSSLLRPQSCYWIDRRRMLSRNHAGYRRHHNKDNCGGRQHHRIPHIRLRPLRN